MSVYVDTIVRGTDQRTADPGLIKNHAGGYVFDAGVWSGLDRFLVMGSTNSTYYVGRDVAMREGLALFDRAWSEDPARVVRRVVELDAENRVMRRATLIFALAFTAANRTDSLHGQVRNAVLSVCRTASDLFSFISDYRGLGGKLQGSWFRRTISMWYNQKPDGKLTYQMTKYRSRSGFSHRDALLLGHVAPRTDGERTLFNYAAGRIEYFGEWQDDVHGYLDDFIRLQSAKDLSTVLELIQSRGFTWEQVPQQFISEAAVWEALAERMPMMALVRNIGRMCAYGVPFQVIENRLLNGDSVIRSRMHPMHFLQAIGVHRQGHGVKGSLRWSPNQRLLAALERAYEASFGSLEISDKRVCLALDVSGSMTWHSPIPGWNCYQLGAAMAVIMNRQFKNIDIVAFSTSLTPVPVGSMDLAAYTRSLGALHFGGTNCSLPMLEALRQKRHYGAFVVITDNETWQGSIKPHNALKMYESEMGPSRMIAVSMTATRASIADPTADNMLDIVGMDANVPKLVTNFIES